MSDDLLLIDEDEEISSKEILSLKQDFDNQSAYFVKVCGVESWVVFHHLLIAMSNPGDLSIGATTFLTMRYQVGIISALKLSLKNEDRQIFIRNYIKLEDWCSENGKHDPKRYKILFPIIREKRNEKLKGINHLFSYALTHTDVEVNEPYREYDSYKIVYDTLSKFFQIPEPVRPKMQTLQFEVMSDITRDFILDCIRYFYKNSCILVDPDLINDPNANEFQFIGPDESRIFRFVISLVSRGAEHSAISLGIIEE